MQALDSDPELIFQPMYRWCRNMSNKTAAVQMPFGCFALRQSAPLTRDCRSDKIAGQYADVVELVDSLDLGSNARACRFESCHPHQISTMVLIRNHRAIFIIEISYECDIIS